MPSSPAPLHLAVALDGTGWHPASWREPRARPDELFTAAYWTDVVREAEHGLLDLVTIDDSLALQTSTRGRVDHRTDQVRGRLDAVLVAARIAPRTRHIGLVPTVITTHTEPFHVSKAIATLDYVSFGRAGVQVRISASPVEAGHFGRREVLPIEGPADEGPAVEDLHESPTRVAVPGLFEEAADYVEVVRRLWDSWEDDAVIRDQATGRFIDREKLHYIDFEGPFFTVRGPSITPRPPQGQPLVAALAHAALPFRLVGRSADLAFTTPHDTADARRIVTAIRTEQAAARRTDEPVHVFADLHVVLGATEAEAVERRERLDALAGEPLRTDAEVFTGTATHLADLLLEWRDAGLSGFRLRPAVIPDDLEAITRQLVPELQRRDAFRRAYTADTLRGHLGLPRPANRYAAA